MRVDSGYVSVIGLCLFLVNDSKNMILLYFATFLGRFVHFVICVYPLFWAKVYKPLSSCCRAL